MRVVTTVREAREARTGLRSPLGLVPTMGYLHEGHLSLVRRALSENSTVAASVFVNPTQFGPGEDLASYPRDLERDLRLLEREGVHLVFAPGVEEMYPGGCDVWVNPGPLAERLEGAARPGHFRGVATVVTKLLNILQPDAAYFGEKDAQQLAVVRAVVRQLHFPVRIVGCETVREPDGLAMSSRNAYLSPEERRAAPAIYEALVHGAALARQGEMSAERIRSEVRERIDHHPELRTEYVSVADPNTFEEIGTARDGALLSVAVRVGRARLIDNVRLCSPETR